MIFKLTDSDFGFTKNGVNYDFDHVDSLVIEDPETTELTRGANAKNTTGISYKQGTKEAKTITVTVMNVPMSVLQLLVDAFKNKERLDVYCVSRVDGSTKMAKEAVVSQYPQQLTVDDTAESCNIALIFKSFNLTENHKS